MRICVYCASSNQTDPAYRQEAFTFGQRLAENNHTLVYGGGSRGSMGALADGALSKGGEVIGITPHFMVDLEWAHTGLSQLITVDSMAERKTQLLEGSDAVVALPGGCGTIDELFEAITLKRLGLYLNPVILLNTHDFYRPLETFLAHMIDEHFMDKRHQAMWQCVATPDAILPAIDKAPAWTHDAHRFAVPDASS